jgi:endonuclease YncB( thermonuclease family)
VLRFLLIAAALAPHAPAGTLEGHVVGIVDGDTIDILDGDKKQHRIRFDGIDAPERGQPFSAKAKSTLGDLVFRKTVKVETKGSDRYDRTVGRIYLDGKDIGMAMLEAGMAWQFTKYDQSREYADTQASAQAAQRGLWSDRAPVPPWEWRKLSKAERDKRRSPTSTK